jgi:hypothetical protein
MTDSIATQLKQASKGLLFLSESDAPFEVIHWPAQGELTPAKLLQLTNHHPTFYIVSLLFSQQKSSYHFDSTQKP